MKRTARPASDKTHAESRTTIIAERIANDIVKCDPSILGLIVIDSGDSSRILAVARSPGLPAEQQSSPELIRRFAIASTVVWGAAESGSQMMGQREFIVGAFRDQLVLLIGLGQYNMLVAIRLSRSSNAEHVYAKIAQFLR